MEKMLAILGMVLCIGGAYAFSEKKKEINWVSVGCAFFGQIVLALLFIKTPLWRVVELMANGVNWLIAQAGEGIYFVFGDIGKGGFSLFLRRDKNVKHIKRKKSYTKVL